MRKRVLKSIIALAVFILSGNGLMAQGFLDNDTLYIGEATGYPGQEIMIRVDIHSTENYQGWQIPLKFGNGSSPVYCDSVSFVGTIMEDWWFTAPLVNNNQWDGVQTCGAAGVVSMYAGSIPPGDYLAMKIFFTISDTANPQTITIDTTTASWYAGGPLLDYIVVVGAQSYQTHVVQGSVIIPAGVKEDEIETIEPSLDIYPTIIQSGSAIKITYASSEKSSTRITLFDAAGRRIHTIYHGVPEQRNIDMSYTTRDIPGGIYFVVIEEEGRAVGKKIIIQ